MNIARQALVLMVAALTAMGVRAEYTGPVVTTPVPHGGNEPHVPPGGEGWFNVGGFCKVVDVATNWQFGAGDQAVLINGPADQWESWRQTAVTKGPLYGVTSISCCPPAANITTLCNEAGATPVPVSRQYGKNGETDVVTATCIDKWGGTYTDSAPVSCSGSNAADGSAQWVVGGSDTTSNCTPDAATSACSATCPTTVGTTTTWDSCGNVTAVNSCSISCCTPSYSKSCSTSTAIYTDVSCGTGSYSVPGGCTSSSCVVGGASCSAGSRTTIVGDYEYFDCGDTWVYWGQQSGCVVDGYDYEVDLGPPNFTKRINVNAGPDHETCYGTCWE